MKNYFLISLLLSLTLLSNQETIWNALQPQFIYINTGVTTGPYLYPSITLHFSSDAKFSESYNPVVQVGIPMSGLGINSASVASVRDPASLDSLEYEGASVTTVTESDGYSYFYVYLPDEVTYAPNSVMSIKLSMSKWFDSEGMYNPVKLALVSSTGDTKITYAHSNSLFNLFAIDSQAGTLTISDITDDALKEKPNEEITVKLLVDIDAEDVGAKRIVIMMGGDFELTSSPACSSASDSVTGGIAINVTYSCSYTDSSITYHLDDELIPDKYVLTFKAKTGGADSASYTANVMLFEEYTPVLIAYGTLSGSITTVKTQSWSSLKLYFSNHFDATDITLPKKFGLYGTKQNPSILMNSLYITFKTSAKLKSMAYDVYIYWGSSSAIVPMSYWWDDLSAYGSLTKTYSPTSSYMVIYNVAISSGTEYHAGFKVAYTGTAITKADIGKVILSSTDGTIVSGSLNTALHAGVATLNLSPAPVLVSLDGVQPFEEPLLGGWNYLSFIGTMEGDETDRSYYDYTEGQVGIIDEVEDGVLWFASQMMFGQEQFDEVTDPGLSTDDNIIIEIMLPEGFVSSAETGDEYTSCDISPARQTAENYWLSNIDYQDFKEIDGEFVSLHEYLSSDADNIIDAVSCYIGDETIGEDETLTVIRWKLNDLEYLSDDGVTFITVQSYYTVFSDGIVSDDYTIFKAYDLDIGGDSIRPHFTNEAGPDAVIYDAFIRVYLSGDDDIEADLSGKTPDFNLMDNMLMLTEDDGTSAIFDMTEFFVDQYFVTMEDSSESLISPGIIHVNGVPGVLPDGVTRIRIFFQLFEPILYDGDNLSCSGLGTGFTEATCTTREGITDYEDEFFEIVSTTEIYEAVSNPLHSTYVDIWIGAATAADDIVGIAIPVESMPSFSTSTYYEDVLGNIDFSSSYIMALDDEGVILANVGPGDTIGNYFEFDMQEWEDNDYVEEIVNTDAAYIDIQPESTEEFFNTAVTVDISIDTTVEGAAIICIDTDLLTEDYEAEKTGSNLDPDVDALYGIMIDEDISCVFIPGISILSADQGSISEIIIPWINGEDAPTGSIYGMVHEADETDIYFTDIADYIDLEGEAMDTSFSSKGPITYLMDNQDVMLPLDINLALGLPSDGMIILTKYSSESGNNLLKSSAVRCFSSQVSAVEATSSNCGITVGTSSMTLTFDSALEAGTVYVRVYGLYVDTDDEDESTYWYLTSYASSSTTDSQIIDESAADDVGEMLTINFVTSGSPVSISGAGVYDVNVAGASNNELVLTVSVTNRNTVYRGDEIQINLGSGNTGTTGITYYCDIRDSNDAFIPYFSSIDCSDLGNILIDASSSEDYPNNKFDLHIRGIDTPQDVSTQPSLSLNYGSSGTAADGIKGDYEDIISITQYKVVSVEAENDYPGLQSALTFTMSVSNENGVVAGAGVIILFPQSYLNSVTSSTVVCSDGDEQLLECIAFDRGVLITGIINAIASGSDLIITLSGIDVPYTSDSRIFTIMHKNDFYNDTAPITEWGTAILGDVGDITSINSIRLDGISMSNTYIRGTGELKFNMTLTSSIPIDSEIRVQINHIIDYETLRSSSPSCSLIDIVNNGQNLAANCAWDGTEVVFTISAAIDDTTVYEVALDGIPTPDFPRSNTAFPEVNAFEIDSTTGMGTLVATSNLLWVDSETLTFMVLNSTLLLSVSGVSSSQSVLQLPIGFYTPIYITAATQVFLDHLTFTLEDTNNGQIVSILSENTMNIDEFGAKVGYSTGVIYVAPILTATQGMKYLKIGKKGEFKVAYTELPIVPVNVYSTVQSLSVSSTSVNVNYGGISSYITISTAQIPAQEVSFDIVVTSENGISVYNSISSFKFSPTQTSTFIYLQHDGITGDIGTKATIQITPSADNLLYGSATINAALVENKNIGTLLTLAITQGTISAYSAEVKITANIEALIYYVVAPTAIFTSVSLDIISNNVKNGVLKVGDVQFGLTYSSGADVALLLTNLPADSSHTLLIYGVSLVSITDAPVLQMTTFTTSSSGKAGQFTVTFDLDTSTLPEFTEADYQLALCGISTGYTIPPHLLYSSKGHNCDDLLTKFWLHEEAKASRLLQNTTSNSTNTTNTTTPVVTYQTVTAYIYPPMYMDDPQKLFDTMTTSLSATTSLSYMKVLMTGLPAVKSVTALTELVIPTTDPAIQIDNTTITSTTTEITIGNVQSSQNGMVNAYSAAQGTALNVTYASFEDSTLFTGQKHMNYEGKPIDLIIKDLAAGKNYDIFIFQSSTDYRPYGRLSQIYNKSASTKALASGNTTGLNSCIQQISIILLSILLLSLIIQIYFFF